MNIIYVNCDISCWMYSKTDVLCVWHATGTAGQSHSQYIIGSNSGYASTGGMLQISLDLTQSQSITGNNSGYASTGGTGSIPHAQYCYLVMHPLRSIAVNIDEIHILLVPTFLYLVLS